MFLTHPRYLERFQSSLRSHALYFPAIAMVLGAPVRVNRVDGLARRYTRQLRLSIPLQHIFTYTAHARNVRSLSSRLSVSIIS